MKWNILMDFMEGNITDYDYSNGTIVLCMYTIPILNNDMQINRSYYVLLVYESK
ncbi:MAG: hypothetical protein R2807_07485 [Chitinophagales bacterium]